MPTLTSRNGSITFGPDLPTLLINDQLCVQDQKARMLDELREGKVDFMVETALWGHQVGTDIVAILITHPDINEVEMLPKIAVAVHNEVGCPIGLDNRHPEALEAALDAMKPHKCIVWTVTAEEDLLESILPIVKKYDAVIAGMPLGHYSKHVPMSAEGRLAESRIIVEACEGIGIQRDHIVIDAVCMAASSLLPNAFNISLETVRLVRQELQVATQLGIGNAGFGMPDKTAVDLAYLLGAMPWGLDAAFVNPGTPVLVQSVRALDMLLGRDETGKRYLDHWRAVNNKNNRRRR